MRVGFAGLTHLGILYGMATAAQGMKVCGFDSNEKLVADLKKGRFPVNEPGLQELWQKFRERVEWGSRPAILEKCDLVFFSLDVSTDQKDRSDTRPLELLIRTTLKSIRPGTTVVMISQVDPGFSRRKFIPLAEKCGLEAFYQVETLVFGRAVERAMHPERFIVGAQDPKKALPPEFQRWHRAFGCPVLVMGLESAELSKIAINFFLVSSVCTTNILAEASAMVGADWLQIAPALRLDARIGPKAYLSPGLGVGGGNLPRDLQTLRSIVKGKGADLSLVKGWIQASRHHRDWAVRTYRTALRRNKISSLSAKVAVWGVAYKEDTSSTKNSPAVHFLTSAPAKQKKTYDPVAILPRRIKGVKQVWSALDACRGADVLVILAPWKQFRGMDPAKTLSVMRRRIVIDPYQVLNPSEWRKSRADCYTLGEGTPSC